MKEKVYTICIMKDYVKHQAQISIESYLTRSNKLNNNASKRGLRDDQEEKSFFSVEFFHHFWLTQ